LNEGATKLRAASSCPISVSVDRLWLYGIALVIVNFCVMGSVVLYHQFRDWPGFVGAGTEVGTRQLLAANGGFMYAPAFAYFFIPAKVVPIGLSYALDVVLMLALTLVMSRLAGRLYGLSTAVAALAAFAWGPLAAAINFGQNAPLALFLVILLAAALVRRQSLLAGLAVGLLLYKPTYALPFILLLCVRREWRALGIVIICAAFWYLASVPATLDWGWPLGYLQQMHIYVPADFAANGSKTVSLTGLAMRLGLPSALAIALGFAVFLIWLPVLARMQALAAVSLTALLAVALCPHAWYYDATLALPALYLAMTTLPEPSRTRIVVASYIVGTSWLLTKFIALDPVILVPLPLALWLTSRERVLGPV